MGTKPKGFPAGFKWGVSSSAYQVEGRGQSIWDEFTHQVPSNIDDGTNGDVACDSYHKYEEDVKLITNMGAKMYRFSISWSRILPDGTLRSTNRAGIDYYNRLIDKLVANGIEPMVTLFHWDTPAALEGDWLSAETVNHFADYARICFEQFGDRVKHWITLNEPYVYSVFGFHEGLFAPGIKETPMKSSYLCAQNQLKAHALAYEVYDKDFRPKQTGRIGISLSCDGFAPFDAASTTDLDAVERAYQFQLGWFAHPIFHADGDYPPVMKNLIGKRSEAEGLPGSRIPELGTDWIKRLKSTADFLGINNYTSRLVKDVSELPRDTGFVGDHCTEQVIDPASKLNPGTSWLYVCPWGIRRLLTWASREYNGVEIIVTENGLGMSDPGIEDTERIEYFKLYLEQVHRAIVEDGVNVTGYLAWSLLDNFEWRDGYRPRFGVHFVDFESPDRHREPRDSAKFLSKVFANNCLSME